MSQKGNLTVYKTLGIYDVVKIYPNPTQSITVEYTQEYFDEYDTKLCFELLTPQGWETVKF